jgi:chromosome segregation ATPase
MASSTQVSSSPEWTELLPAVQLDVHHTGARAAAYALSEVDFLIGAVPGCDLRVPGDAPVLVCLLARHPAGVTLRKLTVTQNIFVNGHSVSHCEIADGDRIRIGPLELRVRILPGRQAINTSAELAKAKHEFHASVLQFREQVVLFQQERQDFDDRHSELESDWTAKIAGLEERERKLAERTKQYEADVLRLNRLEGELEARVLEVNSQADKVKEQREQLQSDTSEMEQQLVQLDELRVKTTDDAARLAQQKEEQDAAARQLAERTAALEGQQAMLAILRGRLERMRDELREREQALDAQRIRQDAREAQLTTQEQEIEKRQAGIDSEQAHYAMDRQQWLERGAVMDAAVRQMKQAQDKLAVEDERLRREAQELEEMRRQHAEADGILQSRHAQLVETHERLEIDRQSLRERGGKLLEREEACAALQDQLRRRADEIVLRHKEITDRLQEYQAKHGEIEAKRQLLDQRELELKQQMDAWRDDLDVKAAELLKKHAAAAGVDDRQQEQMNQLAILRRNHAEERAQFQVEQQSALDKLTQARAEFDTLRQDAAAFIQHLPDAELRAGSAVERLGQAREQLRSHLGEIHQYVRQCQDELELLRGKLQGDLDKLQEQEQTLRRSQDEHRLAMAAFRQQLIDWQGQIAELKRLLARDSTRLERKEAQVDERAKEMEAESERLAQHAEALEEQERDVADRRQEMDRHLVEMREWYRRKLRDLAGIPLLPDAIRSEIEPTILPVPTTGDDEPGIVPTSRSILSIAGSAAQGDVALGQLLRTSELIDNDTLNALLAEARRQRRSLRQVLLASGVITLYQLALIEAGNVQGLMLGPVRIIDRVRNTAHETVYRVFDPRRGAEAVLRHLAEADLSDALKPDEFRQRFGQAMLNDPNLANTLEVIELTGRPAALQEWLMGLPSSDWPPLAAAPGVCYRLLTQAAKGLATAHRAGVVHGHLSDALLMLTAEGVLKICGFGEPPWLLGIQHDDEPRARDDLRALGKIASSWCTPTGVRKGSKTKPLPEALVSVLYRLAADGDPGYADVNELLADLQKAAAAIPPNSEAWDRLLKYVREHGAAEAVLRQSA